MAGDHGKPSAGDDKLRIEVTMAKTGKRTGSFPVAVQEWRLGNPPEQRDGASSGWRWFGWIATEGRSCRALGEDLSRGPFWRLRVGNNWAKTAHGIR